MDSETEWLLLMEEEYWLKEEEKEEKNLPFLTSIIPENNIISHIEL